MSPSCYGEVLFIQQYRFWSIPQPVPFYFGCVELNCLIIVLWGQSLLLYSGLDAVSLFVICYWKISRVMVEMSEARIHAHCSASGTSIRWPCMWIKTTNTPSNQCMRTMYGIIRVNDVVDIFVLISRHWIRLDIYCKQYACHLLEFKLCSYIKLNSIIIASNTYYCM